MVFHGELDPFVSFLCEARASYWRMGDVLGKLEQATLVWKHFSRSFQDARLPAQLLLDLLDVLRDLLLGQPSVAAWGPPDPNPAMLDKNLI